MIAARLTARIGQGTRQSGRQQRAGQQASQRSGVRIGTGWQTLMADLSIILFLITAAALSEARHEAELAKGQATKAQAFAGPSPRSTPLAVYRSGEGAPPLGDWLAAQQPDARQILTIVASYTPGHQGDALGRAQAMAQHADAQGVPVRVVVEPGNGDAVATLAFDNGRTEVADNAAMPGQSAQ